MSANSLLEQTQIHADHLAGGIPGDCWATAIACLLEVPRSDVPHFIAEHPDEGYGWWYATVAWVEAQRPGWTLLTVDARWPVYRDTTGAPSRVILTGGSPRGDFAHAVIADSRTGEVVWDVHPSRAGITSQMEIAALSEVSHDLVR